MYDIPIKIPKKKLKVITIDDNVFKAILYIVINCSQEDFIKWVKQRFDGDVYNESGSGGEFISIDDKKLGKAYCLWLEDFTWSIGTQGTLNHELIHCAVTILADRKISINDETEEVLAYYHTFFKEEAYKKLHKIV